MSSLPSINTASHGKFQKVFHFDQKQEIEQIAREELPATFVHPGMLCSLGSSGDPKQADQLEACSTQISTGRSTA